MNKNRKIKRGLTTSLAVGMSVMMGAVPVYAAGTSSNADAVYKEETVYVNADATGATDEVTVSDWLKNSGSVSGSLTDASNLKDIKNVKGDEKFKTSGNKLTWDTDGEDIYYQGTTDQELPVSVKLTYYLDGKEVKPKDLKGKSGHLKIQVDYTNKEKKTVDVDGKEQEVYTPFVMMTGMILPNENFSNVTIDNGKVISDGSKNIVLGFGMPGMKESLDLDESESEDLTIPESLCIEADVTDFTMSSTFTVALTDLLDDVDLDNVVDIDSLQDSLDDLEDAALQLVSGSDTLADGAGTLADGVDSYTEGADTLNAAIQKYLGSNGELNGSVTEYVNGVNKVVKGVQDYTDGTNTLADGVAAYVGGEQQLAAGAAKLNQLSSGLTDVQNAISQLYGKMDGKVNDSNDSDLLAAANQLAEGTDKMQKALNDESVQALFSKVSTMISTGESLITGASDLQNQLNSLQGQISQSAGKLSQELQTMSQSAAVLQKSVAAINTEIEGRNQVLKKDREQINQAKDNITNLTAKDTELSKAINDAKAAGNDDLASSLESAKNVIDTAASQASGIDVSKIEDISSIEVSGVETALKSYTDEFTKLVGLTQTLGQNLNSLSEALQPMSDKINGLKESESTLEQAKELTTLKDNVATLNAGMQQLKEGIQKVSSGVGTLNGKVQAQFPSAIQGILELNGGFSQLSANNDALLSGASKLKASSSTLVAGVQTLQSGTNQLASGLNTLGSQMSSGAAKLSLNSSALREGAASLQSGAKELADGMEKFDREGTSKLKSTVEDELGDVLDRFDALTSDDCTYTTFSGKDSGMDGSVKFVIETDAIE